MCSRKAFFASTLPGWTRRSRNSILERVLCVSVRSKSVISKKRVCKYLSIAASGGSDLAKMTCISCAMGGIFISELRAETCGFPANANPVRPHESVIVCPLEHGFVAVHGVRLGSVAFYRHHLRVFDPPLQTTTPDRFRIRLIVNLRIG